MSNLFKGFQFERKNPQQSKNKENNLSFRNIAATTQNYQHQSQSKFNQNDHGFKSVCDQSRSFYEARQDLQQGLNYVGSCSKHPNKQAQYYEQISQQQYCKLCAAQLASLGYKLEKSFNSVSRDVSPSTHLRRKKQLINPTSTLHTRSKEMVDQRGKQNKSISSNNGAVKFSTIFSQKNRNETLQAKYEQSQSIIDQFSQIYNQKLQKIQDLINDLRIQDIQYINQIKSENYQIYEQASLKQDNEFQNSGYDLFGKSLLRQNYIEKAKFRLPSEDKIQRLDKMLQALENIISAKENCLSRNKIALIKSINSNSSGNNTNNFLLKNSSSNSNLSNKSNFKKEKKQNSIKEKFGSEINPAKHHIQEEAIESSRFSSNSGIIRTKTYQSRNQNKAQSSEFKRINTEVSLGGSDSCEDTPESMKSKISGNSFVIPKNMAVTMFQKINVCESIDIKPEPCMYEPSKKPSMKESKLFGSNYSEESDQKDVLSSKRCDPHSKSSYANKSSNKSGVSKSRKSFNRYHNFDNQQ